MRIRNVTWDDSVVVGESDGLRDDERSCKLEIPYPAEAKITGLYLRGPVGLLYRPLALRW